MAQIDVEIDGGSDGIIHWTRVRLPHTTFMAPILPPSSALCFTVEQQHIVNSTKISTFVLCLKL